MFPHAHDRYKLLQIINSYLFESSGYTQSSLAKKIKEAPNTIGQLVNPKRLKKVIEHKEKYLYSLTTLRHVAEGLDLKPRQVNALEWLFKDNGRYSNDRNEKYKKLTMQLLDSCIEYELEKQSDPAKRNIHDVEIIGIIGRYEEKRKEKVLKEEKTALVEKLTKIGKRGHRMVVGKFPTSLTNPNREEHAENVGIELTELTLKRKFQFEDRTSKYEGRNKEVGYGERNILSKSTVRRYLDKNSDYSVLKFKARKEHIEKTMSYLKSDNHPQYQIALTEKEPEIELAIHSVDLVCLRTTSRELLPNENPFICGPSYLFFQDKLTILSCLLDFEREWDKISQQDKARENVATWLEKELDKASSIGNK